MEKIKRWGGDKRREKEGNVTTSSSSLQNLEGPSRHFHHPQKQHRKHFPALDCRGSSCFAPSPWQSLKDNFKHVSNCKSTVEVLLATELGKYHGAHWKWSGCLGVLADPAGSLKSWQRQKLCQIPTSIDREISTFSALLSDLVTHILTLL